MFKNNEHHKDNEQVLINQKLFKYFYLFVYPHMHYRIHTHGNMKATFVPTRTRQASQTMLKWRVVFLLRAESRAVTIAGCFIDEAVADVGTQWVLTPLCAFLLDCEGHGPCACGWTDGYRAHGCRPVSAHQAGVEAHAWSGELYLCSEVPAFRIDSIS